MYLFPHFTLQDIAGTLLATLGFTALLYTPGYLAAYAADFGNFRRLPFAEQSLWAIAGSFCLSPIAAHLLGRAAGLTAVALTFAATLPAAAFLLARGRPRWLVSEQKTTALLAVFWTLAVLCLLTGFQIGHKLYYSVVMADQSYRIAFTEAVARTGVPPANPLYFAGQPAPMRYFYFWYVLPAAVMRIAHVSARQAFTASTIWAGFGLLVTTELYTRYFFRWSKRRRWITLALLAVNGADLVPALGQAILQPTLNGNTEWWSVDPIFAWPDSLLWVPHHVAGVLACLIGFLVLWQYAEQDRTGQSTTRLARFGPLLFAGAAFSSAFGLSVYVASGFTILMVVWLLRLALRRSPCVGAWWRALGVTGLCSALLLIPFFQEMTRGAHRARSGYAAGPGTPPDPHLFTLSIRRMIDPGLLTGLPMFANIDHAHPRLLDAAFRCLLLIPGLAMELGLGGFVLVLFLMARRQRPLHGLSPEQSAALFFTVCGLLMTLFISSSVITNNDFGYRAVMLPQFFLLLLTADLLGSWRFAPSTAPIQPAPGRRRIAYGLLWLGLAGTIYWAFLLRAWLPIEEAHPQTGYSHSAEDNFQVRTAFATLDRVAPPAAVVAFRPIDPTPDRQNAVMVPNEYDQRMLVMDADRQMLNAEAKCAIHFGGDPRPCPAIQSATDRLYRSPLPSATWARAYCQQFGVSYLVLSAWDPTWGRQGTGWPAMLPLAAQQPRLKIFACR